MDDLFDLIEPQAKTARTPAPEKPYSALRPDGQFACMICGKPAHFGFGAKLLEGKLGRWACLNHRADVRQARATLQEKLGIDPP